MRKQIAIAAGLAALSTSAWATKARLQALGQDVNYGSLYYSDSRSVFKNPAYVNEYNNYVVTEWGTDSKATADLDVTPSAEGGFFKSAGSINYGFYFGNENDAYTGVRSAAAGGGFAGTTDLAAASHLVDAAHLVKDNVLEVFIGGDAGVQWGVSLQYAKSEDELTLANNTLEQSSFGANLGVIMGNMEGYARLGFSDESEGASANNDKWEREFNPTIGFAYSMRGNSFFVEYEKDGFENNVAGATTSDEYSTTRFSLGWGKTHKVSDSARVYTDVTFNSFKGEWTDGSQTDGTRNGESKYVTLPVVIGMEADANSWLTLRGSVSARVLGTREGAADIGAAASAASNGKKVTMANSVAINAGATLNFGKLKVDGVIGTRDSTATNAGGNTGVLNLDDVMSRVAVHYWF